MPAPKDRNSLENNYYSVNFELVGVIPAKAPNPGSYPLDSASSAE